MAELAVKVEYMPLEYNQDKIELLKNTVCKNASNDEFQLFLHVCKRTGLDPFMKQIYSIPRGGQRTIQTGIDGLRLIAERTGRYSPGREPIYTYDESSNLISATSFIKKMTPDGSWHEVAATAIFKEYNPGNNSFWKKMPHVMLSKCAEAAALRKAFPAEMSGIYSEEEMQQAEKEKEIEEPKAVEVKAEMIEEKLNAFLENFNQDDHENIRTFLKKYSDHWKVNIVQALDKYADIEVFNKDFSKWMKKQAKATE